MSGLVDKVGLGRALGLAGDEPPGDAPAPIDLSPYPPELRDVLNELARWDRQAGRAADRILAADYPIPAHLEAELAYVRNLAKQVSAERKGLLEARAHKLKRRLETPVRVSEQRLDSSKRAIKAAPPTGQAFA